MKTTDEQLAEILKRSLEATEKTGSFIVEQAPDVIQQLIAWKTVQYSFSVLLGVLLGFIVFKIIKNIGIKMKETGDDLESLLIDNLFILLGLIFLSVCSLVLLSDVYYLIQIVFAPKIFLIEYAANLLN